MKKIMVSGVFERMADRLTTAVALPHDLQVVVTDNLPKGVDDPTTEVDGRPAAFSKATHDVLTKFLLEVVRDKGAPKAISQENFTADVLNVWGNQFILGHELGHAVIHQLNLPLTGLEEDSADGFATFFTVNDEDTGPNAALGAAVLFDAMGSGRPNLTMEEFSSDHAVILQRVYNFLCAALGSDSQRLQLARHRRLYPRTACYALRQGMDAAQLRLVDSARATPQPQLQERDSGRPPAGSPEPRSREQRAVRQAQADARPGVSTLARSEVTLIAPEAHVQGQRCTDISQRPVNENEPMQERSISGDL